MPNCDKDKRTPEEIETHYRQKQERRDAHVAAREGRRHIQYEDRCEVREKKRIRTKAKRLHRKAIGTAAERFTPAYMASYKPWDL